ncbi:hypothetical protein L3Y34_019621 [Caenorhabditis briggsae]|uniref:Uncharacterized protein n=1 Tax=Caenorhabditis briggsae TaxID=6238 RepID=A0AAE9DNF4_CAEBR|nr:hypothetical protein L3Y34_019621 [Caenorhabditis briggsae]
MMDRVFEKIKKFFLDGMDYNENQELLTTCFKPLVRCVDRYHSEFTAESPNSVIHSLNHDFVCRSLLFPLIFVKIITPPSSLWSLCVLRPTIFSNRFFWKLHHTVTHTEDFPCCGEVQHLHQKRPAALTSRSETLKPEHWEHDCRSWKRHKMGSNSTKTAVKEVTRLAVKHITDPIEPGKEISN